MEGKIRELKEKLSGIMAESGIGWRLFISEANNPAHIKDIELRLSRSPSNPILKNDILLNLNNLDFVIAFQKDRLFFIKNEG